MNDPRTTSAFFSKGIVLLLGAIIFFSATLVALVATYEEPDDDDGQDFDKKESRKLDPNVLAFSGASAYGFVASQVNFGPRPVMTDNHSRTVDFIRESLDGFGLETEIVPFSKEFDGKEYSFKNIVARKQGSYVLEEGSGDEKDVIVFGAHFDTRDIADRDTNPENRSLPILGANDGGSGVAVLLELAHIFSKMELAPTLEFVFFDGEDFEIDGTSPPLAGSAYHAENLEPAFKKRVRAVVVVDMVGDRDLNIWKEGYSTDSILDTIFAQAEALGYQEFKDIPSGRILDDHLPFIQNKVPAVDIIDFRYPNATVNYWHTQEDTFDKVSEESLAKVGKTLELFVYNVSARLKGKEMLAAPLGTEDGNYRMFVPRNGTIRTDTSEYGTLNITRPATVRHRQFFVHDQLNIGIANGSRNGDGLVLRNCTFVPGSVEHDFFVDIGSDVTLDNCSFIFNNKEREIHLSAGIRRNSISIQGEDIVLKDTFIHNSPGFAVFITKSSLTLTGGLISGSENGGLTFTNSTADISSLETRNNIEFAIRALSGSKLVIKDSRFFTTELEEECTNCGPPPVAPAIEVQSSEVTIDSCLFRDNHAGVQLFYGKAGIKKSRFIGNQQGIDSMESELSLEETVFRGNGKGDEHGIVSDHSIFVLGNSTFSGLASALILHSSPEGAAPLITNTEFASNQYGIILRSSTAEIRENSFTDTDIGLSLNTPKNVTVTGNNFTKNRIGVYLSSPYKENYSYSQNISGNDFHKATEHGILLVGALDLNSTDNSFTDRPAEARDMAQRWWLDIWILNGTINTTIELERNGSLVKDFILKSGENVKDHIVDEYWVVDGERTEAGPYTITVTRPAEGGGQPETKTEDVVVDSHIDVYVEFEG